MWSGLVLGIVCGVVVLGILTPLMIRWYTQRKKNAATQLYYLPPPVQERSLTRFDGYSKLVPEAQSIPAAYEQMTPRPSPLSEFAPPAIDHVSSSLSSAAKPCPRTRPFSELAPVTGDFMYNLPTMPDALEDAPQPASYNALPPKALNGYTEDSSTVVFVDTPAHIPTIQKARTFQSSAALARHPSLATSDPVSALVSPMTLSRSNTIHSMISSLSFLNSPSPSYREDDTPVVHTAVMYNFLNNNWPRWNRVSTIQHDQGLPPVQGTTLVPTAYVPYRPPMD